MTRDDVERKFRMNAGERLDPLERTGERVQPAAALPAAREGDVQGFGRQLGFELRLGERFPPRIEGILETLLGVGGHGFYLRSP